MEEGLLKLKETSEKVDLEEGLFKAKERRREMRVDKRRFLTWIPVVLLLFSLSACKTSEKRREKKKIKIGITLYDSHDTFITGYMSAFDKEVAEKRAEGYEVDVLRYNAEGSQSVQNEQVEEMLQNSCDVLCINLVDRTAPSEIIDMAKKKNTPVVFFNRELVEEDLYRWNQLYYVGADAKQSGILQGELVAEDILAEAEKEASGREEGKEEGLSAEHEEESISSAEEPGAPETTRTLEEETAPEGVTESETEWEGELSGRLLGEEFDTTVQSKTESEKSVALPRSVDKNGDGKLQYVLFEGEAGHQDAIMRTEYVVSTLQKKGIPLERLGYGIANWSRAEAQSRMMQLYSELEDKIELILSNNDDMALGVLDAYDKIGVQKDARPWIYGIDGTMAGINAVKKGAMKATVYNDEMAQAKALFNIAFQLATEDGGKEGDRDIQKITKIPYRKVTGENYAEFRAEE